MGLVVSLVERVKGQTRTGAWAQSRCNKIQVCKRWSAGEPESPARGEASPLHEVPAERVKQEDWFNGGQPQRDDADDRPMTDDGKPRITAQLTEETHEPGRTRRWKKWRSRRTREAAT